MPLTLNKILVNLIFCFNAGKQISPLEIPGEIAANLPPCSKICGNYRLLCCQEKKPARSDGNCSAGRKNPRGASAGGPLASKISRSVRKPGRQEKKPGKTWESRFPNHKILFFLLATAQNPKNFRKTRRNCVSQDVFYNFYRGWRPTSLKISENNRATGSPGEITGRHSRILSRQEKKSGNIRILSFARPKMSGFSKRETEIPLFFEILRESRFPHVQKTGFCSLGKRFSLKIFKKQQGDRDSLINFPQTLRATGIPG